MKIFSLLFALLFVAMTFAFVSAAPSDSAAGAGGETNTPQAEFGTGDFTTEAEPASKGAPATTKKH